MKFSLLFILFLVIVGCTLLDAKKKKKKKPKRPPPRQPRNQQRACKQGICVVTYGKAGKFSITQAGHGEHHPKTMTVFINSISERDKFGHIIGNKGPRKGKHSFNNFAGLDFAFSKIKNTTYMGVKAMKFNFSVIIPGPGALLNVPIYLFTEKGTIYDNCGDGDILVKPGIVKYDLEVYHWRFCKHLECSKRGSSLKYQGAFLDFSLTVRRKGRAWRNRRRKWYKGPDGERIEKPLKFFFGKSSMSLPSYFEYDSNCTNMVAGFPTLRTKKRGMQYIVHFRFSKFNNYLNYDSVMLELEDSESPAVSNSSANVIAAPDEPETKAPTTAEPGTEAPSKPSGTADAPSTTEPGGTAGPKEAALVGKGNNTDCNSSSYNIASLKGIAVALIAVKWIWIWG